MILWLMENGAPVRVVKMLEGLHWVLELSTVEQAQNLVVSQKLFFLFLIVRFFRDILRCQEEHENKIRSSPQQT